MSVTFVAVGVASEGSNASRTPALPAGIVAGDLLLCLAAIRNSGAGVPNAPTGWTTVLDMSNCKIFGKIAAASESAPTVTFTGGVTNATCHAQIAAWRGPVLSVAGTAAQLNATAQNIAYPALSIPRRALLVYAGWKQDDWTSVASLAGATEIAEVSTTTGDDAGLVWDYVYNTSAASTSSGSFVVTGGATAISRGGLLALDTVSITVQEQDVYPPRVLITVSGLEIGDAVEIDRSVVGERTPVRAAVGLIADDPNLVRTDAELPFGVPVTYIATVNGVDYSTSATTYTLPGGKVAFSDAITGLAAEVVITDWPEKQYDLQASVFKAGGRNIVVSGDVGQFTATVTVYTETTSSADNLFALLGSATENAIQIRQGIGHDDIDSYVSVLSFTKARYTDRGDDQRRLWTLSVAEVDGWADTLEDQGFTLQDLADAYTGQTLADLAGDYVTLLDVAQGDFS